MRRRRGKGGEIRAAARRIPSWEHIPGGKTGRNWNHALKIGVPCYSQRYSQRYSPRYSHRGHRDYPLHRANGRTPRLANDLTPIGAADWNYDFAARLLERAGFGGTPEEIQALPRLTPAQAVARLVRFEGAAAGKFASLRTFRNPRSRTGTVPSPPSLSHRPRKIER